jgi:hypothetical protein
MPSLDTVRTVTIKGQADGVDQARAALDRLTASIAAANDNITRSNAAATAGASGFNITGEGALKAANHIRQAAEAAYAFSPAFRGMVNELAAPALQAAGVALSGVSTGIVSSLGAAGMVAARFLPVVGQILLVYDAVKMLGQAWQLGGEKLAEYVAIADKASGTGLSTDFYQRISKAATEAKTPVEVLTKALQNLNDAATPVLGGTAGQNRLVELVKAGNFSGNSGIGQLTGANSTEERLRAITALVDQAMQKGERLAALDIAKTFLGAEVANNLARDQGYLDKMVASADKIAADDLVSSADIQNAVELQNRLDAAEKILSQRWHPIQTLLTELGIKMRGAWVGIVEAVASAVDGVGRLVEKLGAVPSWFANKMNQGATAFMNLTTTPEGRAQAEKDYGITSDPAAIADLAQRQDIEAARSNEALMKLARERLAAAMHRKFDTSIAPAADTTTTGAFDRAEEALRKYIEVNNAAASSIDLTAAAQERLKAIAQLTAAGMKDGLTREAAAAKAEMSGLAAQAGAAADALARAQIASSIRFGMRTSLLSADDVAIATALKTIYPDVATALGSVEAQGMRVNNAFKALSSSIESSLTTGLTNIVNGTASVSSGFKSMAVSVLQSIEQMIIKIMIVQPLMQALQASVSGAGGMLGLFGLGGAASTGTTSAVAGASSGMMGGVPFPMFASGTDSAPGGWSIVGEKGPELMKLPQGAQILPNGRSPGNDNGGSQLQVNVTLVENPSAQGAVSQRKNNNGGVDIEIAVAQIAARSAATPGAALNRVLVDQMGSAQRLAAR